MGGLTGDWNKLRRILNPDRIQSKLKRAHSAAGVYAASAVKKGIRSGAPGGEAFEPLSAFTVASKGSSKPLINHGDLIGSITHENLSDLRVFVGVKKNTTGRDGRDIVRIAAVHEFGCTIPVTSKMRGFLGYKGLHLKKTTMYIHIPERSFLRATINDPSFRDELGELYLQRLREYFLP